MFTLRDLKYDDYTQLFDCGNDPEAKKFYDPTVFESKESLIDYFNNYFLKLKETTGLAAQVIEVNKRVIGLIYFCYVKEDASQRAAEVAFILHKDFRKKGIMSKALSLLIAQGFNELNLDAIQLSCYPNNYGAIRLAEKLNMKFKEQWFADSDLQKEYPINTYEVTK